MERIVIEVTDATAKSWRNISPDIKLHLEQSFARHIEEVLQKVKEFNFEAIQDKGGKNADINALKEEDFQTFLNQVGAIMKERGLTEDALREILKDDE